MQMETGIGNVEKEKIQKGNKMQILFFLILAIILFSGDDKERYVKVGNGWNAKVRDTKTGKNIIT